MSLWREQKNEAARARLDHALPPVFPRAVLVHAFARPLVPALPRRAVESYWHAHPLRADRLARALAARSGPPPGWTWRTAVQADDGLPRTFRAPPAPFREGAFARGPGHCCICGQPVYRYGWHADLWGEGRPNTRAGWHACCVAAWKFWTAPNDFAPLLRRLQRRRCGATGHRLLKSAEVDHRVPLFTVWRDRRDEPWPALLRFWGLANLQVINRTAHVAKCLGEVADRVAKRSSGPGRHATLAARP